MSVTLRQLRAFLAVAEARNFTRAADELHVTQPVASALVRELERELGFRLFDRTTRRVELTEAASELMSDASRLLRDFDESVRRARDVSGSRRGRIRVGAPPLLATALLPKVMAEFARSSPGVSVVLADRTLGAILELLNRGELDLGIGTFRAGEGGLVRTTLVTNHLAVFCMASHPLAARAEVRWRDLADAPLIALRGGGIREQVERGFEAADLEIAPLLEVDQMTTALALVEAGFGVTVLPVYALAAMSRELAVRTLTDPVITRDISVVHRGDRSLTPAAAEFIQLLRLHSAKLQP